MLIGENIREAEDLESDAADDNQELVFDEMLIKAGPVDTTPLDSKMQTTMRSSRNKFYQRVQTPDANAKSLANTVKPLDTLTRR